MLFASLARISLCSTIFIGRSLDRFQRYVVSAILFFTYISLSFRAKRIYYLLQHAAQDTSIIPFAHRLPPQASGPRSGVSVNVRCALQYLLSFLVCCLHPELTVYASGACLPPRTIAYSIPEYSSSFQTSSLKRSHALQSLVGSTRCCQRTSM